MIKQFEKKEVIRSSTVRLKGLTLILEGVLASELPMNDPIIHEVRMALVEINDRLHRIQDVK